MGSGIKVVLHIGPGKTGTSAIQKWLLKNRSFLKQSGIFYPKHKLDENGVSSGNYASIFDRNEERGRFEFNAEKASELLKYAADKGFEQLLLSSEVFFPYLDELLSFFNNVKVIFYVRDLAELAESSYNQSVKRHRNIEAFRPGKNVQPITLSKIADVLSKHPHAEVAARFYERALFKNGSIIEDFVGQFTSSSLPQSKQQETVNPSYSLEALEFKRFLNRVGTTQEHVKLDKFLQSYRGEINHYSLMAVEDYERYKQSSSEAFAKVFEQMKIDGSEFLTLLGNKEQKPFHRQLISATQANKIVKQLKQYDLGLFNSFISYLGSAPSGNSEGNIITTAMLENIGLPTKLYRWLNKFSVKFKPVYQREIRFTDASVDRLTKSMQRFTGSDNADSLRELAMFFESNEQYEIAYALYLRAKSYREEGPLINKKIEEIAFRLGRRH